MSKRVVVTGLGCVTPLGPDVQSTWSALLAGTSGVGPITLFDTADFEVKIGAEVKGFDPSKYMSSKEARRIDRFIQLGIAAAREAWCDAGLDGDEWDSTRAGVLAGSGIGGIGSLSSGFETLHTRGPDRISPFLVVQMLVDLLPGQISINLGLRGPNFSVVSACATSGNTIGEAAEIIKRGDADVMLAGGAEAGIVPIGVAAFHAMRALSTRNDAPQRASRPFDKDRDGFVMGEAGGMIVLESLEHALARGARVHAELAGYGTTADAHHVSSPSEQGEGAAEAMRIALRKADLSPRDVDYISAHATATPVGDLAESMAIKAVFGPAAQDVPVSSIKSMTGHLLGAAGVVEGIACIKAIQDGMIPPTINLDNPDEGCDLDYVPNEARRRTVDVAIDNTFGFGGHNCSLVLARFRG
ncbi:MAG: beta-ketoacyl-ACP synthase II [Chloroflexota bacterium]|nr:beta-ketoacyl-ACP synthase II [Chloroflexota bacterium]